MCFFKLNDKEENLRNRIVSQAERHWPYGDRSKRKAAPACGWSEALFGRKAKSSLCSGQGRGAWGPRHCSVTKLASVHDGIGMPAMETWRKGCGPQGPVQKPFRQ